jgi:hypothetical protein
MSAATPAIRARSQNLSSARAHPMLYSVAGSVVNLMHCFQAFNLPWGVGVKSYAVA